MNRPPSPCFSGICILLFLFFLYAPDSKSQPSIRDSSDLSSFLDGLMEAHLKDANMAGATLSVVQDGRILLAKGYGFLDVDAQIPVDPSSTLFRVGSISKLFVWTAVMQLVQQGKIDLEVDVTTYLPDLKIPKGFNEPITMRHLMTHTPGFEDRVIGLFAKSADELRPLGRILREEMPARVRSPGLLASYSNHGTGIAAYIVEQVAGLSFDDYVDRYLLQPLRMDRSTFQQPVPKSIDAELSKGYAFRDGVFQEKYFEFIPLYPVGALSATATDMARFMLAHLQLGRMDNIAILDSATATRMQREAFRHAPGLRNPSLHGFYSMNQNDVRIFGHGGNTFWFHSQLALIPDYNTGIFISFNTEGGSSLGSLVLEAVIDRYFPIDPIKGDSIGSHPRNAERFTGVYRSIRYPHKRLSRMLAMSGIMKVKLAENGLLETQLGDRATLWRQIDPTTFQEKDGWTRLAFRENKKGEVTHLFLDQLPVVAFEAIPKWERPEVVLGILVGSFLIFLFTLLGWITGFRLRVKYHVRSNQIILLPQSARWVGGLTAFIFVLYFGGVGLSLALDPTAIVLGVPESIRMLSMLPIAAGAFSIAVFILMLRNWGKGQGTLAARVWYTFLAIACLLVLLQLWQWRLLGLYFG